MTPAIDHTERFHAAIRRLPLVAILRGIAPDEAVEVVGAVVEAGFTLVEVPLNSPRPIETVALLARAFPRVVVGAGTVLEAAQVDALHAAGAQLVVAPNFDAAVVRRARALGLACLPGVATPTEAFAALAAGATGLKLFPAEAIPASAVAALRAVLPLGTLLCPVGGITPQSMAAYRAAGAGGFGIGSALYKPGRGGAATGEAARIFVEAHARAGLS